MYTKDYLVINYSLPTVDLKSYISKYITYISSSYINNIY